MEIKTDITKRDLVEFQLFQLLRCRDARAWWMAAALLPPLLLIGAIAWGINRVSGTVRLSTMLLPLALVLPLYLLLFYRVSRLILGWQMDHALGVGKKQALLGERLVLINERGVEIENKSGRNFRRWETVLRVVANGDYGYIYTGTDHAIIIPRRCFSHVDEAGFRAFMKAAIIYHWQTESVTRTAGEEAAKRSVASAKAQGELEPSPALNFSQAATVSQGHDTEWSPVALKNTNPSEAVTEASWY